MLLTPTILAVDAAHLTLLYAEDVGQNAAIVGHNGLTSHTVEHVVTFGLTRPVS